MTSHADKNLKLTLHVPPGAKQALEEEAARRGLSRNAFIISLLQPYLPQRSIRAEKAAKEFEINMRGLAGASYDEVMENMRREGSLARPTVGSDVTEDGRYVRKVMRQERDARRRA